MTERASGCLRCVIPVVLSAGMLASGLEDRISMGWEDKHYLLKSYENPEGPIVLVPFHPGYKDKTMNVIITLDLVFYYSEILFLLCLQQSRLVEACFLLGCLYVHLSFPPLPIL